MQNKSLFQAFTSVCLLSASLTISAAEPTPQAEEDKKVFRKFHTDGVVEFTDQPSKGSEELKMEELPTYKFGPAIPSPKLTPRPKQAKSNTTPEQIGPYTSLAINSPAQGETLRSNSGKVDVKFTLVPGLQFYQGHQIEYLLDGKSILKSEQLQPLKNISRGDHTLVIQVIDKNNKLLIRSNSVSFHVKRFFKSRNKATPPEPKAPDFDADTET